VGRKSKWGLSVRTPRSLTCRRWLLLLPLLLSQVAQAQTYAVVDSIEVHGLVFLGKIEHPAYSYTDSVRCQFAVANRSQEPIGFSVTFECDALFNREVWCDSSGAFWDCTPSEPILRLCGGRLTPYQVVITPGEHIIATGAFPSLRPEGPAWWLRSGQIVFLTPWPEYSPYFEFAIPYRRLGPTSVNQVTWSIIKARYR
jgi:hypothetical protein